MDDQALVVDFKRLLRRLQRDFGPVALLMLVADYPDNHWEVRVSAKGLDEMGEWDAVSRFLEMARETLQAKTRIAIGRVHAHKTDDLFVRAVHGTFGTRRSAGDPVSGRILDVEIPLAIILRSQKIAVRKRSAQRTERSLARR